MVQWVNRSLVQAPRNGTTAHTVSFAPATAGNLLVCVVEGAVTSSTPTGWTLPPGGSAINNSGLYVWHKTATSGESSLTTTHNGSNYPAGFVFYEFAAGSTFAGSVSGSGLGATAANPNLTGLTGTNMLVGVAAGANPGTGTVSVAWSGAGSPIEDVDVTVPISGTDGYWLGVAYVESSAAASFQPTATVTNQPFGKEALTFAVKVTAPVGAAFSGSVALSGAGSLTRTGKPAMLGPVNLSGSGALVSTGQPAMAGSTSRASAGTLALAGVPNATGTLALSGSGSLALTGNATGAATGTLNLAATGTLTLTGAITAAGSLNLAGMGALTLTGVNLGLATDATVTAALGPPRWSATLTPAAKTGALQPRRWAGEL